MSDFLQHYGTPRHSGRYPWGSGDEPYQHTNDFLTRVDSIKANGITKDTDIAKALGMSTGDYRAARSNANAEKRAADRSYAIHLRDDEHMNNSEIGRRMGLAESSVRSLFDDNRAERASITKNTADILKSNVDKHKYIDVGQGVENRIGISHTKLNTAVKKLVDDEGYHVFNNIQVEQMGTGKKTTLKVLAGPDSTWDEVRKNVDKIRLIDERTEDDGRTYLNMLPPVSIDSNRVKIRYSEDGGKDKDGVIELRKGVDDISLGNARYAQVRIAVDGDHYLKGMAMYSDDIPKAYDIVFNTNKSKDIPKMDVLKKMKTNSITGEINEENPFGASIKEEEGLRLAQRFYIDKDGNRKQSAINIVNEEGDWENWSKNLPSQFLSKQSTTMAKKQLGLVRTQQQANLDEILSLTNPAIEQKLLDSFADDCDSKAVHLKAASLPRQQSHVILPLPNVKESEVYAPNYRDGEHVVLVRYPHGGKFEIPELVVNNHNPKARSVISTDAPDAIGIHPRVAERLSGADFDGDTVVVIPVNNRVKVGTSKPLNGLKDFDPQERYPKYEGMKVLSENDKQTEMGKISNLITDMTLKNAPEEDIARAVKHSMVVIDATKHELNYKQSAIDNQIPALKKKYQGKSNAGASTLISKAKSDQRVGVRKEKRVSQMTEQEYSDYLNGAKIWDYTGDSYSKKKVDKKGNVTYVDTKRTFKSSKMEETDDAYKLTSGGSKDNPGTVMESIYADYANSMKAMANTARKESRAIKPISMSNSAKETYAAERASLDHKINIVMKNKPLERRAQIIANTTVAAQFKANPDLTSEDKKKYKGQALDAARHKMGKTAGYSINITDKEWEAIQAGAISQNKLSVILDNTDLDKLKERATPRSNRGISPSLIAKARSMVASGNYTQAEIADALNISVSTLRKNL